MDEHVTAADAERPAASWGSHAARVGIAVSVLAVAGVVWWALRQDAPELPDSPRDWLWLCAAVALYAVNTALRGERWHRLLVADGARPRRADTYSLTVIGYAVNNVLPARAGDAARVLIAAPCAETSRRAVIGTLVAERLLDVAVILLLFVVVGYGVLGEVGGDRVGLIAAVTAALAVVAVAGVAAARRNARLAAFVAPMLSSTLGLRSRTGAVLLAMTALVWALEAGVWMAAGAAAGFRLTAIEGLYLVALASVFALIPSGPGYAGTQDAAALIGAKALGASGATAVGYLLLVRFVLIVPITLVGFALLAARYGGLSRLRAPRRAIPSS